MIGLATELLLASSASYSVLSTAMYRLPFRHTTKFACLSTLSDLQLPAKYMELSHMQFTIISITEPTWTALERKQGIEPHSLAGMPTLYRWAISANACLFQAVNIMNRHVVTVNIHMILWRSTLIDTLWDLFRIYPSPFYLLLYRLSYLQTDPTPVFNSDRVVRPLIQDCGNSRTRTLFFGFSVRRIDQLC